MTAATQDLLTTKCDQCGSWDDHPKVIHSVLGDPSRDHPMNWRRHHDCVPHADKLAIVGGSHSQHPLITAKIFDACIGGTRGGDLREFIAAQAMKDYGDAQMASGIDQTLANTVLNALLPKTSDGNQTVGTATITPPIKARFDSAMGSDTASATEWSTAGGYTAGGVSVANNWNAAASGSRSASATISVTNAPAQTWAGNELWDSSGSPQRILWGSLSGGNKTVNSGDTASLTSLSGSLA